MLTAGLLFVSTVAPHATKAFDRQLCCYAPLTPMVSLKQAAQAHQGGSFLLQPNQKKKCRLPVNSKSQTNKKMLPAGAKSTVFYISWNWNSLIRDERGPKRTYFGLQAASRRNPSRCLSRAAATQSVVAWAVVE